MRSKRSIRGVPVQIKVQERAMYLIAGVRDSFGETLDWAPMVWVLVALWIKLIYFSAALRNTWSHISLVPWVFEHRILFTTTLAILLVTLSPFPLIARRLRFASLLLLNLGITTLVLANLLHAAWYGEVLSIWSSGPM